MGRPSASEVPAPRQRAEADAATSGQSSMATSTEQGPEKDHTARPDHITPAQRPYVTIVLQFRFSV
jgi:hypothetical protein